MKVMQFRVGEEVEVFYALEKWSGKVGAWIPATVLKVDESEYYEVETRTLLEINRMKMRVGRDKIRPRPSPEDDQYDRIFEEGQVVEIRFFHDLWITGKVWEVHHHGTAGRNNISYSVLAVDPYWCYLERKTVSKSQVRVRREWVDGEWVPTPPLRLHNQQGLFITSIKSRDFSSGLKDHSTIERRSEERTTLLQLRDRGAQVEVFEDFMNKWMCATIKDLQENQIRVQYTVWSWVKNSLHEIDKFYDMSRVRLLLPPEIKYGKISLNLHQVIEVWNSDYLAFSNGWCLGEVLEIGYVMKDSNCIYYCVSHPRLGYINVEESEIRICQKWENGQGFQPSSALNMAPPLKRRKMEETRSLIGAEVEVYSFYHDGWITVTKVGSVGNQIEVEAEIYRKLWRITVDACRIRSRPAAERENNRIFKENEVVEVRLSDSCVWMKGEIWEVHHGTSWNNLFYTIKVVVDYDNHMELLTVSKSQVRVRRKWVEENWTDSCIEQHSSFPSSTELKRVDDGTWGKRRKLEDTQFCIGDKVEVFNDEEGGWKPGRIILELRGNQILVESEDNMWDESEQQLYDAPV
ncbi:protein AGENET DOMAIN (AGD)-CONTAINING P1-like, partial [Macadamia integrifolia]|uniref:protein AGENET DOMAIN (AGD)-CONTAINING P1-like n=1 Tax=Macadamia integrifolia TaxID=60698 RepID=UPI001C4F077B